MSAAQDLIDRRRLRRKLGFWRVAAILLLLAVVVGVPLASGWRLGTGAVRPDQIALVEIEGVIREDQKLLALLDELKDEDRVKAVILRIDSPGGTTVGGEALYRAARAIAEKKPLAAEVGTLAASAGYMVAAASDHIVAHDTSIVGSIGVLFQYVDASRLLGTIGVGVESIKSSPLKAEPSPFAPAPEEAKEMIRRMVLDTYEWFVVLVRDRRQLSEADVRRLADGSVFTGRQGLSNRLVDALGGEAEVRTWLENDRGVPRGLEIVERKPAPDDFSLSVFASARALVAEATGLALPAALPSELSPAGGLMSLWQPGLPAGS